MLICFARLYCTFNDRTWHDLHTTQSVLVVVDQPKDIDPLDARGSEFRTGRRGGEGGIVRIKIYIY